MAERTSTCDSQVERETLRVYSYTPRALSFVPQSTFCAKVDRTHDRRRPGAYPLASKIAWPNTERYVKDSLFLPPLPQDLPQLGSRIVATISDIDCDLLQRVWAGTDYRLDVCRATTIHMRHGGEKKTWSFSFHQFVTFYNPFRSSSVPILWSVSGKYESHCSLHHSPAVTHSCCSKTVDTFKSHVLFKTKATSRLTIGLSVWLYIETPHGDNEQILPSVMNTIWGLGWAHSGDCFLSVVKTRSKNPSPCMEYIALLVCSHMPAFGPHPELLHRKLDDCFPGAKFFEEITVHHIVKKHWSLHDIQNSLPFSRKSKTVRPRQFTFLYSRECSWPPQPGWIPLTLRKMV
jgi:hypothetical protein